MIVVFGTMVRTPSYVIRALRLLGVDVRSVEVEVKGEVNDRNMTPVLRLLSSISQMIRLCGEVVMEVLKKFKSIAKVIGRFPRVFRGGITKPFDKVLMTASTDA